MGFFDTIYVITIEALDNALRSKSWYWDKSEAEQVYDVESDGQEDRIVTLYALDLRDRIDGYITELMKNRHSHVTPTPLQELRSNRQALDAKEDANDVTWGELEFRPENGGEFYIERRKASTHEYWPYSVDRYTDDEGSWRVWDDTTRTPIGIVKPGTQNECFKAVVNGYSQTPVFTNLKGAVIHIATEYNGV